MKLVYVSGIATGIVLVLGALMVVPTFLPSNGMPTNAVLLSFVISSDVTSSWCQGLSDVLDKHNAKAAVYLSGQVAEKVPSCVTSFSKQVDIGSQTYRYVSLSSITDYSIQLDEIKQGKESIDAIGDLDSKLFKAPFGNTDENIYSLLSRSGIYADFSYDSQYNKYYQEQFIKFDLDTYDGTSKNPEFFKNNDLSNPSVILFDSNTPVSEIDHYISELHSRKILLVNPSEITGIDLTVRHGGSL